MSNQLPTPTTPKSPLDKAVAKALFRWLELTEPCSSPRTAAAKSAAFDAAMRELHAEFLSRKTLDKHA